jgi:hypothetical protein
MFQKFQECIPHPVVHGKDKAYWKFLLGIMSGESYASEVNFDDDIDDFLTPTNISRS